jgi:1-acyl-sn-glycerol-3-phosphate acyltransferase
MQTRLRRVLDAFTTGLAWVMMRVFFRDIEVAGLERVPRGVPVVVVANHANSIVDPMLMLAFLGIKPRILAKSTLWRHPVIAPFLVVAGAIPVFRPKEANPARNVETFARCGEALAEGKAIALFPEGTSHDKPTLQPLKTGAARMVLQAQDAHEGLQVLVLPVGLIYEAKDRFRSRVVVNVGEAIVPAPAATGSLSARAAAARSLTRQIAEGLGRVVVTWAAWQAGRADATRRSATSQAGPRSRAGWRAACERQPTAVQPTSSSRPCSPFRSSGCSTGSSWAPSSDLVGVSPLPCSRPSPASLRSACSTATSRAEPASCDSASNCPSMPIVRSSACEAHAS